MTSQRHIIDYRNSTYQGGLSNTIHSGLGTLLDENLMFSIGQWVENHLQGHCFIIFPDHKMFYGQLQNRHQNGICVYILGNWCYLYGNFHNGKLSTYAAIDFRHLKTVIAVQGLQNSLTSHMKLISETMYENENNKWSIIEKIINTRLQDQHKSYTTFIQHNFNIKYNYKIISNISGGQTFIGLPGQTLGVKINVEKQQIMSMGHYSPDRALIGIGMKAIQTISGTIFEEGNYSDLDSIIRYQARPKNANFILRKYCFQSMNFKNRYYNCDYLNQIWHLCMDITHNLKDTQTEKYAQILLENPNSFTRSIIKMTQANQINPLSRVDNRTLKPERIKKQEQQPTEELSEEKFDQNRILEIKQEVDKFVDRRKNSSIRAKDILREFSPSELRSTPNKRSKGLITQQPPEKHKDPSEKQKDPYQRTKYDNRIEQLIKQRNIIEKSHQHRTDLPFREKNIAINKNYDKGTSPKHSGQEFGKVYTYFPQNKTQNRRRQKQRDHEQRKQFKVDAASPHYPYYTYQHYGSPQESKSKNKVSFNLVSDKLDQYNRNKSIYRENMKDKNPEKKDNSSDYQVKYDRLIDKTISRNQNSRSTIMHKPGLIVREDQRKKAFYLGSDYPEEGKQDYSPIQKQVSRNRQKTSPYRQVLQTKGSQNKSSQKGYLDMYKERNPDHNNPEKYHPKDINKSPNKYNGTERTNSSSPLEVDLYLPYTQLKNTPNNYYNQNSTIKSGSKPRKHYKYVDD